MKNKNIAKSVAVVTIFSVFTRGISFLFKIYLSRKVGAEVMGLYQIAVTTFYLFAGISAGGLATVLSRRTAEDIVTGGKKSMGLTTAALIIGGVASLLIIVLLYVFKDALPHIVSDGRAVSLFQIMSPALLTTTIYNIIRSYFWGKKDFTSFSITETLEEILRIVFTALLVSGIVSGISGAEGIAIAFTLSDVAVATVLVILYFIKGGKLTSPTGAKELLASALPVTGVRVFGSAVSALVAILLPIGLTKYGLTSEESTAVFGKITGMANPLLFAPNAIISSLLIVLIPEMSSGKACGDRTKLCSAFTTGTTLSVLVSGLFMAIYLATGKELCSFLFKDAEAGIYLEYASLLMLLSPLSANIANTLNSIGLEKEAFFSFLAGTALLLPAVIFLTPIIGMYAIIVGNGLSLIASIAVGMYFLKKRASLKATFILPIFKIALAVLPSFLIAENIANLLSPINSFLAIAVGCIAACVFYIACTLLLKIINIEGVLKSKLFAKLRKHNIKLFEVGNY